MGSSGFRVQALGFFGTVVTRNSASARVPRIELGS